MNDFSCKVLFIGTLFFVSVFTACKKEDEPLPGPEYITLLDVQLDGSPFSYFYTEASITPTLVFKFSEPIDHASAQSSLVLSTTTGNLSLEIQFLNGDSTLVVKPNLALKYLAVYYFQISSTLTSKTNKKHFEVPVTIKMVTTYDPTDKFERISDTALLDTVQKRTLKYFYEFAHPASGMARERNTSGNTVTSGGSGFGVMALIVGMERSYITREQGIQQATRMVSFLEKADRFHGAWSHWIDGNTGKVIPFSSKDNGGDLVETSFLIQGLITLRQYLQPTDTAGNNLINRITTLWEAVEWDWYRKNNENVLYWHWSPNYTWEMNFAMYGYFEQQITYVLAAASPTHGIPKIVYTNGFARNGNIVQNNTYYGINLKLGGLFPLFWTHYSYLGLDPHFSDEYADYWEQNVNATLINRAYCIANPKNYAGYGEQCWGLTSSDNQSGYGAHSPANDNGVITPTAALSSLPYTPDESMMALRFFYYTLGDKLWGPYGFYDSFNLSSGWVASSY
ncbi:MAG TPA: glucoamylase family protein, partial [Cyclobacteriaceae bacterium]|nr:glucoamylase family protein [Cyclobacteriaceae bacterium]